MAAALSIFAKRFNKAIASVRLGIRQSATTADASVPLITSGSAVASASDPDGSLYLRTGGAPEFRVSSGWKQAAIADQVLDGSIRPKVITDPGSGAIPITDSGTCAITTVGAETRTVAIPTFAGQILGLSLDVDGGDCVVTFAAAVNQAGNNTATFADAGDHQLLQGVTVGGALVWRQVINDGAGLTTV